MTTSFVSGLCSSLLVVSFAVFASTAYAVEDDGDKPISETAKQPAPQDAAKKRPAEDVHEDKDGVRFRGGISAGGGFMPVARGNVGGAAGVGGVDGRLGVQIMDLLAVYAQPHVAIGSNGFVTASSAGGTVDVELTFIDHIFVGAGGGGGLQQFNETWPCGMLHFRAGGYPYVGYGVDGVRRKGLMIGVDLYVHFAKRIVPMPMLSIGYEAF